LRCMYSCTFLSISSSSIAAAASSDGRLQGLGLGSDERDGAAAVEEDGETHEEERGVGDREKQGMVSLDFMFSWAAFHVYLMG
jgi:hypothetical protein